MTNADLVRRHALEFAKLIGAPTEFRRCKNTRRPNRLSKQSQRKWDSTRCRAVREALARLCLALGMNGLEAAQLARVHPFFLHRSYKVQYPKLRKANA